MAKKIKIPATDSIQELAVFWDAHDITDFNQELEEITDPVFEKNVSKSSLSVILEDEEVRILEKIARQLGKNESELVSEWIHHKIHEFI